MTNKQINELCANKREELINKYFGDIVNEAAHEMSEVVDENRYPLELPDRIVGEYRRFLEHLLPEIYPGGNQSLEEILDKKHRAVTFTEYDREQLEGAYNDAKVITLWEKIKKSNHEDVTYYKGLLKAYTEELLNWMEVDFIEDMCKG